MQKNVRNFALREINVVAHCMRRICINLHQTEDNESKGNVSKTRTDNLNTERKSIIQISDNISRIQV